MMPTEMSAAEFDAAAKDDARWQPAARTILARHAVAGEPRRLGGSMLVYAAGDRVLKLFPPVWATSAAGEIAALEAISGRLAPVASPEVVAAGELEGWPYFVMSALPGQPLETLWSGWDGAARRRAAASVGELLARLHGCPLPSYPLLPPGGWPDFLTAQAAVTLARQRERGLGEADLATLAAALPDLLAAAQAASGPPYALLHTEIGPGHVHFDSEGRAVGVLDFADALVGPPLYEGPAAGVFVTRGDPALFAVLRDAAGWPAQPRVLWAFTVLFRYAHLPWYLRETGLRDLAALSAIYGS